MPDPILDTPNTIEIPVRLDSAAFQEFSMFDVFRLRGRWRLPVLFAVLMFGFACACFALQNGANQAVFLGFVLLGVGLGLPLVYFLRFLQSVKAQCKKSGLDAPRGARVYTVLLSPQGVTRRTLTDPPQSQTIPFSAVYGAWRTKTAIYLYVDAAHALLLPNGQANAGDDAVWAFLQAALPGEKCHLTT